MFLESPIVLTFDERIGLEEEAEAEAEKPQLTTESGSYLWLCFFTNGPATVNSFKSLLRQMDGWSTSMRGELWLEEKNLDFLECQVGTLWL